MFELEKLKTELLNALPFFIGEIRSTGEVSGLDDNTNNYFYINNSNGRINFTQGKLNQKSNISKNFSLVVKHNVDNELNLFHNLIYVLTNFGATINEINNDSRNIIKQETNINKNYNINLISINFALNIDFILSEKCLTKICQKEC